MFYFYYFYVWGGIFIYIILKVHHYRLVIWFVPWEDSHPGTGRVQCTGISVWTSRGQRIPHPQFLSYTNQER